MIVLVGVVAYFQVDDALEVFLQVDDESLHEVLFAAQHVPVEHDVLPVQFGLERFDSDVHRAYVGEYPVEARCVHLGGFHVECELLLFGGPFDAEALLAFLGLGEVEFVGQLVKGVGTLAGIQRGGCPPVLDAHVAHDELELVLERFADFLVLELYLAERARRQVRGAEHAVRVYLEMPDKPRVLAAVVDFRGIAVAGGHGEVEREVGVRGLFAGRNGLRDLDETILHKRPLVLYREVVLDAVVRHLQHLRRMHRPFRLGVVLHAQVRVIKQPGDWQRDYDEDCRIEEN